MKVRIKRQDDRRSAPYWQVFHFRGEGRITVAAILEKLNERDQLEDIKGKQCRNLICVCPDCHNKLHPEKHKQKKELINEERW